MAYARGYGGYGGHSVSNYGNGAYGYGDSSVNFCPAGLGTHFTPSQPVIHPVRLRLSSILSSTRRVVSVALLLSRGSEWVLLRRLLHATNRCWLVHRYPYRGDTDTGRYVLGVFKSQFAGS